MPITLAQGSLFAGAQAGDPRTGRFFIQTVIGTKDGYERHLKNILGDLRLTSEQAQQLGVGKGSQLSPYLYDLDL